MFLDGFVSAAVVLVGAVASLPVVRGAPAPLINHIEARDSCHADNLLRLLRATNHLSDSLPFCSSYLGLPASATVTVSTVTPTVTQHLTNLVTETSTYDTTPTEIVTETSLETWTSILSTTPTTSTTQVLETTQTDVFTTTPTQVSFVTTITTVLTILGETITTEIATTSTAFFTETITVSTTTTSTSNAGAAKVRRARSTTPLSDIVVSSYDPPRISSACACLTIILGTTSVTATAPEVTSTSVGCQSARVSVTETAAAVTETVTVLASVATSVTLTAVAVTETVTTSSTTETSVTLTAEDVTETSIVSSTVESSSTVTSVATELSSTGTSVTTTTTTTVTSVITPGFMLRSYRASDNFYSGNYLVNRNISPTDKRQGLSILARNTTAPRFVLTAESYLQIQVSKVVGSAVSGDEYETWIAYKPGAAVSEALYFDKLANVQACSSCTPLKFATYSKLSQYTNQVCNFLGPAPEFASTNFEICGSTQSNAVPFPAVWESTVNPISNVCFQEELAISQEGQPNCFAT